MSMTLLDRAKALIYGERADAYGDYAESAERLASIWSGILGVPVPVEKVPAMMIGLKLSRISYDPTHTDSWVDIAGYAGCAGKLPSIWQEE
jgi:hypothetical protein